MPTEKSNDQNDAMKQFLKDYMNLRQLLVEVIQEVKRPRNLVIALSIIAAAILLPVLVVLLIHFFS